MTQQYMHDNNFRLQTQHYPVFIVKKVTKDSQEIQADIGNINWVESIKPPFNMSVINSLLE